MITVRKAADRGQFDHGWRAPRRTFSFADYYDDGFMGFRALRVINEDRVKPGRGFGTHGHRDMEIISYVLEGSLGHRDSTGGDGVLRPGEVQRMSAGTGVRHSEMNASDSETTHFLQIWITPERAGIEPGYEQKAFPDREGRLRLVASRDGRDGSLTIHQDVDLFAAQLDSQPLRHDFRPGRYGWLQIARGSVTVNGIELPAGDRAAIDREPALTIRGKEP